MEDYKSFYYDTDNFAGLPDFIKTLYNKHWVPVVTAAIPQRIRATGGLQPYLPYHDGLDQGIFINASAKIDQPFTGQQWADDAVYVDWSHTNSSVYWDDWLAMLQSEVAFDGVWLDMNEATSFCNGPCYWDQTADQPVQQKLKYIPSGRNLEEGAIALDAVHSDGSTELDVHSLYGTQQTEATAKYFKNTLKKRPMIISRSNFAGQGKFGSRTLGDNFSTGHYMGYSTTGVMASNIAGVPLAGADICGFNGDSNADLCTRWYTVGSFYPFSRNHNARDAADQEPYVFTQAYNGTSVTYLEIIRNSMFQKMSLIRYYYSEMAHVSRNGGAFFKPLFFDYPNDIDVYSHQNRNIMLGNHLKLGILSDYGSSGMINANIYFPVGLWCEVFNVKGTQGCITQTVAGSIVSHNNPWEFYLHMREGSVVPMQDNKVIKAHSTKETQEHATQIHILPNCTDTATDCVAQGIYYNDDGETLNTTDSNLYQLQYTQAQGANPTTLTLKNAIKQVARRINANDDLDGIQIYNANAYGFTASTYSVTATLDDGSTVILSDTTYVQQTDRLVYAFGAATNEKSVSLVDLAQVVFTKKA